MTPTTKKGRAELAERLADVAREMGATVDVTHEWPSAPSREAMVRLELDGVSCGVTIGPDDAKHGYCLPWCSSKALAYPVARATGYTINPFHHKKCTAFAADFDSVCEQVRAVLALVKSKEAFQ